MILPNIKQNRKNIKFSCNKAEINLRSNGTNIILILLFLQTDIEHLSQQLMARLANPPTESATIFIDDPSSRNNCLGPRQIEVRCVYLEDLIGKILWYCVC